MKNHEALTYKLILTREKVLKDGLNWLYQNWEYISDFDVVIYFSIRTEIHLKQKEVITKTVQFAKSRTFYFENGVWEI